MITVTAQLLDSALRFAWVGVGRNNCKQGNSGVWETLSDDLGQILWRGEASSACIYQTPAVIDTEKITSQTEKKMAGHELEETRRAFLKKLGGAAPAQQ